MVTLQKIALVFTIIGALVWAFIGIFDFNLISFIFGDTGLSRIFLIIVGASGVINIGLLVQDLKLK